MTEDPFKKILVRVPASHHDELKQLATEEHSTVNALIRHGIRLLLDEQKKTSEGRPVTQRLS